jgi:hypothetical protein
MAPRRQTKDVKILYNIKPDVATKSHTFTPLNCLGGGGGACKVPNVPCNGAHKTYCTSTDWFHHSLGTELTEGLFAIH